MIKAIIYDMDDVIINTYPVAIRAEEILLKKLKSKFSSDANIDLSNFIGRRVSDMLKATKRKLNLKIGIKELTRARSEIFGKERNKIELLPGIVYSLDLFKDQYKLALTSSGTKEYIEYFLNKFDLKKYFCQIISGDDVVYGKPDPEPYLKTVKRLNLKPDECLVIEDAENGVVSAKSAGCFCIAIENKYTPKQDLSRADLILESLEDIKIEIINSVAK